MNHSSYNYAQSLIASKISAYRKSLNLVESQLSRISKEFYSTPYADEPQTPHVDKIELEAQRAIQQVAISKLEYLKMAIDKVNDASKILPFLIYDRFTTMQMEELHQRILPYLNARSKHYGDLSGQRRRSTQESDSKS